MTLVDLSPNIDPNALPDYFDPEILAGLGSGTLQLSEVHRPLAVVPKERINELYEKGAHSVWNALSALLAPGVALQLVFDDEQNLQLVPVVSYSRDA